RPRRAHPPVSARGGRLHLGAAGRRPRLCAGAAHGLRGPRADRGDGRGGGRAPSPRHHLHVARLLRRADPPLPGPRAHRRQRRPRGRRGDCGDRAYPARRGAREGPRRRDRRRQDDRRAPPRRRSAGGGMKVGLTGFAGAGKTTVFTALTGLQARPAAPGAVNLGVIKVPDPRVDKLAEIYHPRKTTYAEVTFVDFPPAHTAERRAVLDAPTVAQLRDADALVEVVRGVPEVTGAPATPAEDVSAFAAELVLADLAVVEKRLEPEIAQLEPADRGAFLHDLGLAESARDRFIRASYHLLDLVSFLTAGEDECRAWPIRRGTTALKAAGKIHSDIERGFIRAEV